MKALLSTLVSLPATLSFMFAVGSVSAEEFDASKLPPPAAVKIEFTRDIKPIFEQICWRCHSGERPKSRFRLTDRESALKGGGDGIDIIPGQSAKSPLVYYVARLVKDMEMPPEGRGPHLTPEQVGLFCAWIDQGVVWEEGATAALHAPSFSFAPTLRWYGLDGDRSKFREMQWARSGWDGGAEDFRYQQKLRGDRSVSVEGHVLRDDYKLEIDLRKQDLGFTRFGYQQFRKYYDDSGGYYAPFSPSLFNLDRDLHLDLGRAWAEVGLTLPKWPRLVLGYEYQFKEGDKSMLTWGPVVPPADDTNGPRSFYPAAMGLDERSHLVRLDASYDLRGFMLEDNARAEWSSLTTRRQDPAVVLAGQSTPSLFTAVREGDDQFRLANTFHVEKQPADWLFVSAGYLYSSLDASGSFRLRTEDGAGQLAPGFAWASPDIVLKQSQHVFNLNSQLRPLAGLTAALGVQSEWRQQHGFGDANLDTVTDPNDPTRTLYFPALTESHLDDRAVEENVALRYTKLPCTTLFAEARLKQENLGRFDEQTGDFTPFVRDADATSGWQEYRGGFSLSPWRQVSLSAQYKHRLRHTDYDNERLETPAGLAYPGFIRQRAIDTDAVETKLVIRPATWLKTTLACQLVATDYHTTTDATDPAQVGADGTPGGKVFAGQYDAHIGSVNVTLTPHRRLYLATTFAYQTSETTTANNGDQAAVPYRGDIYSVLTSLGYVLDQATDLSVAYSLSQANYAQHNEEWGLPLGVSYDYHSVLAGVTRRFKKNVTGRLQYGYYLYNESSSGHFTDYTAHVVFATVTLAWP